MDYKLQEQIHQKIMEGKAQADRNQLIDGKKALAELKKKIK